MVAQTGIFRAKHHEGETRRWDSPAELKQWCSPRGREIDGSVFQGHASSSGRRAKWGSGRNSMRG
jgi:hypothetical protein